MEKTYFFGWTNIKWFVRELGKMGSNEPSFFSQKRIFQFIGFGVLESGCIAWLKVLCDAPTWSTAEFLLWAGVNMTVCGFALTQIQKEKVQKKHEEI